MKTLCLALLIIFSVSAINLENMKNPQMEKVQGTSWGRVILQMVEIATEASGPLNELTNAIDELVQELTDQISTLDAEFNVRSQEYQRDSERLENLGNDAQITISSLQDQVDNVIVPAKESAEQRQKRVMELIKDNSNRQRTETASRNKASKLFEDNSSSHSNALEAIDECIALLSGIVNTGSLAEVYRIQGSINMIQTMVSKRDTISPLILNIAQLLESQNFADQSSVKNIITLFNDLRNTLVDQINQSNVEEKQAQQQYEQSAAQLATENAELQSQLTELAYQIAQHNTKLQQSKETIKAAKTDLATFAQQKQANDDLFAQESQNYQDTKKSYFNELEATLKAQALITSPEFKNSIRVN